MSMDSIILHTHYCKNSDIGIKACSVVLSIDISESKVFQDGYNCSFAFDEHICVTKEIDIVDDLTSAISHQM